MRLVEIGTNMTAYKNLLIFLCFMKMKKPKHYPIFHLILEMKIAKVATSNKHFSHIFEVDHRFPLDGDTRSCQNIEIYDQHLMFSTTSNHSFNEKREIERHNKRTNSIKTG